METLFNDLILKHISFTPEDLEEFDCDEQAFIKMDLEENDKETRRRACYILVQRLRLTFPERIMEIVQYFQEDYLKQFQANRKENQDRMIAVINLIIASTIKRYSFRAGATEISLDHSTLKTYITTIILPELEEDK